MKNSKESLIQQSKKLRFYNKWGILAVLGVIVLIFGIFYIKGKFFASSFEVEAEQAGPYTVRRGDIKTSIEGEGKIINPNVVNLSFLVDGTLDSVSVKEGDKVKKGDLLAELDKREYEFNLHDAESQVQIVQANIKSKQSEITDDDLKVAQNDIDATQKSVELTRKDLQKAVDQAIDLGIIELETDFVEARKALESIDNIFGIDRKQPPYLTVQNTFNNAILESQVQSQYQILAEKQETLWNQYNETQEIEDAMVSQMLWQLEQLTSEIKSILDDVQTLFYTSFPSGAISQSLISEAESAIQSSYSTMSSKVNSLISARQKIENAFTDQQSGLVSTGSSLESESLKLENTQLNLEQRNASKEASLLVLYAQLAQAKVKVEKAEYDLDLTRLTAPIDGEVIAVNGNPGEAVKVQSTSSENALVRVLSNENFTTEVYIEEVDIAKVKVGQKVNITLDALEGVTLGGEVSYISSTATIDGNSITTYLVRIDITDTGDVAIKEGMTTYTEFLLQEAEDVVIVPVSAVKRGQVQLENGEFQNVETGATDGKMIEIKSGLEEGQKILAVASQGTSSGIQSAGGGVSSGEGSDPEARFARIESLLKEQGTLPEGWEKMSTDEKQKYLQSMRETNTGLGGIGGTSTRMGGGGGNRPPN